MMRHFSMIERAVLRNCNLPCTGKPPKWSDECEEVAINPRLDRHLLENKAELKKALGRMTKAGVESLLDLIRKKKGLGKISRMDVLPADPDGHTLGYVLYFFLS